MGQISIPKLDWKEDGSKKLYYIVFRMRTRWNKMSAWNKLRALRKLYTGFFSRWKKKKCKPNGVLPWLICDFKSLASLTVAYNFFSGFTQECGKLQDRRRQRRRTKMERVLRKQEGDKDIIFLEIYLVFEILLIFSLKKYRKNVCNGLTRIVL